MPFFIKACAAVTALIVLSNISASGTTISLGSTIDIPHRTVMYEGKTYEIQNIGVYSLGEDINITINATEIKSFQLSLLDKNKNFLWSHITYYTEGTTSVVMPGSVVTVPGTYALAVLYQGDVKAVKPVVVSGYKISVMPDTATIASGGTLHIRIDVAPDTEKPIKAVLVSNSSSLESSAYRTGEGVYEAIIKMPVTAHGRFSLYAAIASNNTILGYPELIGVSSGGIINVTQPASSFDPFLPAITFILAAVIIIIIKRVRG